MSQGSGRIVCPQCGANNFDTVTVCWKCGAALGAGSSVAARPAAPVFGAVEAAAYRVGAAAANVGNPATANRAAIWLGLLMPYFGLPIGLAFLMCDDRRRQEVGRICVLWSVVALAAHLLLGFVALLGMREYFALALNAATAAARRSAGGGGAGFD